MFLFMVTQYCVASIFRYNLPIFPKVEIWSYKVFSLYQSDQKFAKVVLKFSCSDMETFNFQYPGLGTFEWSIKVILLKTKNLRYGNVNSSGGIDLI